MPHSDDSVLSVAPPVSVHNGEGGEKGMASEWEELEKLSKDELIIELVHWKTLYSMLRSEQDEGCRYPDLEVPCVIDDEGFWEPGQVTSDEWAEKIAAYAAAHATGEDFYPSDLIYFGLTDIQAFKICDKLCSEGRLVLPSDVRYYDPEEDM